ncbi:DUF4286 family protein [Streptomyces sp. GQFP]|uniref:DUF4286 family protein n=1 Tax=Streptomyces sp. GQFP TaxID=2907545 RepID=UPI001F2E5028|nr:DUF4286 family protein [Streptomyces sp. GQFP]UIX29176.1 hypothetical protein LUX31_03575 [Streptomyces sp. GQFP]
MRYLMIAQTTPVEGRDDEFNAWYDGEHLKDVLAIPGFVAAERFEVASGEAPFKYYAFYEVEAESIGEIWAAAGRMRDSMATTEALGKTGAFILSPLGSRVTGADFTNAPAG